MTSAADGTAPLGRSDFPAPLRIGSEEHKQAFCRMLLDTFDPYKPSVIDWPTLDEAALKRITSLPFWDVAVQTEGYASIRVQRLADTVDDRLLKEAVALNAFEEARHKSVLEKMVKAYGITLQPEPVYKAEKDAEWSFLRTGYGECFDSFFAFGLFEVAKRSGFFPMALVDVFEPVVREEGRHILFFVNWVAWRAANKNFFELLIFRARCFAALMVNAFGRLSVAGDANSGDNFVASGGENLGLDISIKGFLELCLSENDRRMALYDTRLLRPLMMPRLIGFVLSILKLIPEKKGA
jgi:hypothetical protein